MKLASFHKPSVRDIERVIGAARQFVFLDTARPDPGNTRSYVFVNPRRTLRADALDDVTPLLESIDTFSHDFWVAGYLSYEAAYGLDPALRKLTPKKPSKPFGWFGVFDKPYVFDHVSGTWNPPLPKVEPQRLSIAAPRGHAAQVQALISQSEYSRAIHAIRRCIARGETYQINFTYDVTYQCAGPAFTLYRRLRDSQPAPYCALLSSGEDLIASFSPELFFRVLGKRITVQPMKGTAGRGRFLEEDRALRDGLAADEKNRSENIMIVDLMRNDLGKICETGSVCVPKLYTVETLPTLHQMTSLVRGVLKKPISMKRIFTSVFPSGSVTGAPKIRSMEIIRSLEKGHRGVYCGAIGFVSPKGEAVFSVPIRTLQSTRKPGMWRYRVGSGIVWDSKELGEWKECAMKCDFLTKATPDFDLFESLLWDKRLVYKRDHMNRLKRSAQYFFFAFNRDGLIGLFTEIERTLNGQGPRKVRVFLAKDGSMRWDSDPIDRAAPPLRPLARLSLEPLNEGNPLLFHKTTHRPWYGADAKTIREEKLFDVVHVNSREEITEGSRCNVFISRGDMLLTPPVTCGLLPGVLRENLLRREKCREEVLKPKDLLKAEAVYCGNSVRGLVRVKIAE